jgi:phage gp46-like protein
MADLMITKNNGFYDISFDDNGDFQLTTGFDTAILMSFFVDKRADSSEVAIPENRRGWWGDTVSNYVDDETGSKIWLFEQSRLTTVEANKLSDEAFDASQWFLQDKHLESLDCNASISDDTVILTINYKIKNSATESNSYELWENTVRGEI